MSTRARGTLLALGAALAPLVVLALVIAALRLDPTRVAAAFARGSVGTSGGLEATLKTAVPLLLCGLAVALGFKAGVFNLGAEGQLVAGAIGAAAVGLHLPAGTPRVLAVPLALSGGALAGASWAAAAAWLKRSRGAPEVLATLLLNFVAIQLGRWLVDLGNPLNETGHTYPQSDELVPGASLSPLLVGRLEVPLGIVVAVVLAVLLDVVVHRTRTGLELRLSGTSPGVARATGFSPARATRIAFLGGGALAGLAGALGVVEFTHRLYATTGEGSGYTAVAVALVAGLRPALVIPSALAFAALESGARAAERQAGMPRALAQATEGLLVLAVLAQGALARRLAARAAAEAAIGAATKPNAAADAGAVA